MLFFATDTGSALTPPVIRVTATVFLVAKTIRSVTETHCFIAKQHCFIAKQHCFLKLQHCFATNLICFVARKSSSLNGVALPAPATHCFGVKQYCFFILQHYIDAKQHWFFKKQCDFAAKRRCFRMNQHCFVTKTLCSVTMQPSSGSRKPCFFPETRCSITKTLASGADFSSCSSINLPFFVIESTAVSSANLFRPTPKPQECFQHLRVREVRVAPARVRQHEHARAMNRYGLRTDNAQSCTGRCRSRRAAPGGRGWRTIEQRLNRAIDRYADERHHSRTVPADLSVQHLPPLEVFSRTQVIDSWTRPRNQIGDAEVPFGQPIVIFVRDRLRRQPRIAQKLPKSV